MRTYYSNRSVGNYAETLYLELKEHFSSNFHSRFHHKYNSIPLDIYGDSIFGTQYRLASLLMFAEDMQKTVVSVTVNTEEE